MYVFWAIIIFFQMTETNENNFNLTKNLSRYKLWVKYKVGYLKKGNNNVRVYYSNDRYNDPEYGRRRLLCLVKERINYIEVAILYDNTTHASINYYYTL